MNRRDLQQADERRVRNRADEIETLEVDIAPDFVEKLLAIGRALGGPATVTDPVTADNQDMGLRTPALDFRKGADEAVIASVGFEVAIDEGDNFITGAQLRVRTADPIRAPSERGAARLAH